MDLSQWNNEWDPPDPLKGRRGWARHHYVARGVFALLLLGATALLIPAALHLRRAEVILERAWERQWKAHCEEIGRTTQPP